MLVIQFEIDKNITYEKVYTKKNLLKRLHNLAKETFLYKCCTKTCYISTLPLYLLALAAYVNFYLTNTMMMMMMMVAAMNWNKSDIYRVPVRKHGTVLGRFQVQS